ncbi:MAG: right-handed parallel beta-helix repeat-containing protein, partial [Candidatus Thorarchaeota archaeon]
MSGSSTAFRVCLCIVFMGVLFTNSGDTAPTTVVYPNPVDSHIISDYSPHSPIVIDDEADLISQGWPGSGSPGDPFLIQGYIIDTVDATSLSITGTTSSILIENCYFSGTLGALYGVYLQNVVNVTIRNCILYANNLHVYVNQSTGIFIESNNMTFSRGRAVYVEYSPNTIIWSNLMNATTGVELNFSPFSEVFNNTMIWQSYPGRDGLSIHVSEQCNITDNRFFGQGIDIYSNHPTAVYQWIQHFDNNTIHGDPIL